MISNFIGMWKKKKKKKKERRRKEKKTKQNLITESADDWISEVE